MLTHQFPELLGRGDQNHTRCGFCPMLANLAGAAMSTVTMAGASTVSTRNDRVRTRCKYSRLMISHVLRMAFAHRFDEDFL